VRGVHQKEKTQVNAQIRRANLGHQYILSGALVGGGDWLE